MQNFDNELKAIREAMRASLRAHLELSRGAATGQNIDRKANQMEDCAHNLSIAVDALQIKLKKYLVH